MEHIVAFQGQPDGSIHRHSELVGRDDPLAATGVFVLELKPPLVARDVHVQNVGGSRWLIKFVDRDHRPDPQGHDQDGGNNGPGDF